MEILFWLVLIVAGYILLRLCEVLIVDIIKTQWNKD